MVVKSQVFDSSPGDAPPAAESVDSKQIPELAAWTAVARVLFNRPAIVFLDESFSQLDHVTSRALRGDFQRIAREFGKTCLLVTHRIDDALELADRALVLTQGASVVCTETITETTRADPAARKDAHDRIAAAMGDVDQGEQDAEYEVS